MRKIILISGLAILFFTSCERHVVEPDPYADFGVEYSLVTPGEVIFFENFSLDADRFEWDFGDGTKSYAFEPTHYYQTEGTFRVSLAAFRGNKVDYVYLSIKVYETTLEVEVVDWETEVYVPNVDVTLYTSFTDWYEFTNAIVHDYTNLDGFVIFKGMQTIEYFIDAWSPSFNNQDLGEENENNIKTAPLQYAKHNVFTAYVDYRPNGQVSLKSTRMRVKPTETGPTRSLKDLNRIKEK